MGYRSLLYGKEEGALVAARKKEKTAARLRAAVPYYLVMGTDGTCEEGDLMAQVDLVPEALRPEEADAVSRSGFLADILFGSLGVTALLGLSAVLHWLAHS